MKLIFHGGAMEVGRSCIELDTGKSRFLLDAGLFITEQDPLFPTEIKNINQIKAVFITHAHLDHTGALPLFEHLGLNCDIFATQETKTIAKLLLIDSFKVERIKHSHPAYQKLDINKVFDNIKPVHKNGTGFFADVKYSFMDAGHIPGSAHILLETMGKKILYTGDFNTTETKLLLPSRIKNNIYNNIDVMITESTYGNREHPKREDVERDFVRSVTETINNGGSVLLPAFGVGRAQELLLILGDKNLGVPLYMDGMARSATERFFDFPECLKNPAKLRELYEKAIIIKDEQHREEAMEKQGIFITTSGMVNGGPVMEYLKHICYDQKSAILLSGYQADDSNGKLMLDEGFAYIDGWKTKVKCKIEKYDFSAHAGLSDLKEAIKSVSPKKLIIQHGDPEAIENLGTWAKENTVCEVFMPKVGEEVEI